MARATTAAKSRQRGTASHPESSDSEDRLSPPTSASQSTRTSNGDQHPSGRATEARSRRPAKLPSSDTQSDSAETPAKPKRRRGSRGGRRHRRGTDKTAAVTQEPSAAYASSAPSDKEQTQQRRGSARSPAPASAGTNSAQSAGQRATRQPATRARARIPVTGAPTEQVPEPFAHNAEYEFARILDFYGIDWQYEPRSFPLRWERGHVTEAFTPDFYLPDLNLYVELTTLKSSLTAEKNRKMRLLKELYPEVNVIMLKKRDYLRLLAKYGYGPLSPGQVPDIDRVLLTTTKIQQRVGELGAEISRDYASKEPVLVGVLRGVMCFISDLMRHISVPTAIDLMAISSYEGNGAGAVRILKDLDENIKGRDVILVEDIVDTGMTLNHVIDYLQTKRPASIRVCTLLDKRARRIVNVPLDYVAFEIPDEFVVGYGLDFHQRFRNLPFIAVLKHELLP
jgi:hypoxanthine phosphoribosyltransferase